MRFPGVGERPRPWSRSDSVSPSEYRAISRALDVLLDQSWPVTGNRERTARIADATTPAEFHGRLDQLFAHVHGTYQDAHFWVKNSESHFLGVCPNLLNASGLDRETLLSGINDVDARLPWMRQGPLYIRDDRDVLLSGVPKLDILERQDRGEETIWLKTSKVPYAVERGGSGGTVGGFQRISAKAAWKLRLDADES